MLRLYVFGNLKLGIVIWFTSMKYYDGKFSEKYKLYRQFVLISREQTDIMDVTERLFMTKSL